MQIFPVRILHSLPPREAFALSNDLRHILHLSSVCPIEIMMTCDVDGVHKRLTEACQRGSAGGV